MAKKMATRTQMVQTGQAPKVRWKLEDAFLEFLRAKRLEQLKPRTLIDHETHFRYLTCWLKDKYPKVAYVDQITVRTIRGYVEYMLMERTKWESHQIIRKDDKGLSPVTVNIRLRTLRCLFRWLTAEGLCAEDPTANVSMLRTEDDMVRGFTLDEVKRLFVQPDRQTYVGYRDYVLMVFLLDTGARIRETLMLQKEDLDLDLGVVHFPATMTKSRKGRSIPLSKHTVDALRELMMENEANFGKQERRLFLTIHGTPLEPYLIRTRIKIYGHRANITGCRVSPHTFRHTFARMYIRMGGDAFTLQKLLGHSTMEMVRRYVQMEQGDLKDAHSKFSPLNQFQW